jgi:hypothetical protein
VLKTRCHNNGKPDASGRVHMENREEFDTASQRVIYSHLRSLAEICTSADDSQQDLHSFFQVMYQQLYEQPKLFGLPVGADACLEYAEPDRKNKLVTVNRTLDRPRKLVNGGLDYLSGVGSAGQVDGKRMVMSAEEYRTLLSFTKVKRQFIQGLAQAGWMVEEEDAQVTIINDCFPQMMPALKALAEAARTFEDEKIGRFHFARCDFRVLQEDYTPNVIDLYSIFDAESCAYLLNLHEYLTELKYKPQVEIYGIHAWVIKYQGNRKVKASSLYQVDFMERDRDPLRVYIKCASANRLVDIMPDQPYRIQEDFYNRTFHCSDCGWCNTRKSLGPTLLKLGEQQKRICWFVLSDLPRLDGDVVGLVKQYIDLHETLAPLN